jgi:hypothetical protein
MHRDATAEENAVISAFLASRLSPCQTLAAAIAHFQADLAAVDGPHHQSGRADERLAALILRLMARLAAAQRDDPLMAYPLPETTALDDFIDTLEESADRVLGPSPG